MLNSVKHHINVPTFLTVPPFNSLFPPSPGQEEDAPNVDQQHGGQSSIPVIRGGGGAARGGHPRGRAVVPPAARPSVRAAAEVAAAVLLY